MNESLEELIPSKTKAKEENMAKYSESVMSCCRQRLGLEESDTSCDLDIAGWNADKVFRECIEWVGIINYDMLIRGWIEEIYGIQLIGYN